LDIVHFLYNKSNFYSIAGTVITYALWTVVMLLTKGRTKTVITRLGVAASLVLIFMLTIFGRTTDVAHDVSLVPFASVEPMMTRVGYYRTVYLNIILFIPLGLSLPFALPEKIKRRVLLTVASGFLLSVIVEATQFVFQIGKCETDDVLMNTLGVFLGATSYWIYLLISKRIKKKENL
jgi:glycopeptide antibiotics resistance protein